MADLNFSEPSYGPTPPPSQDSFFMSLVIRTGLAQDRAGAQKVLLVVFAIIALIAGVVFFSFGAGPAKPPIKPIPITQ